MREGFLLDPEVAYFNHGSYGACPVEVFDEYQRLQLALEREPTEFLTRRFHERDGRRAGGAGVVRRRAYGRSRVRAERDRRAERGDPLAADPAERGDPHDEARVRRDPADARVHPRERRARRAGGADREHRDPHAGVVVSHITSPTALVLPVDEICAAARQAGVFTIVDGAHVPGQLPLDIEAMWPDVYAGNCHKWLCAPKGSGFLWARPEHQDWIEPARRQLGLSRGRRLRRAPRLAGDARSGRVPRRAEGDRGARDVRPRAREGARGRGRARARALRPAAAARQAGAAHAGLTVRTSDPRRCGSVSTTSTGSRCPSTSGRATRSCASRSARTTTRPTSRRLADAVRQALHT